MIPPPYIQIKIFDGSVIRATNSDQTAAILAANSLTTYTGRPHSVEIYDQDKLIGLLHFSPPTATTDAVDVALIAEAAAFVAEIDFHAEIARSEPAEGFMSKLKYQGGDSSSSIFTTRDYAAAVEAVKAWGWAGCRMRANGKADPIKGQSWLIICGKAEAKKEVA